MDNDADIVVLFVCHKNETLTLVKFGPISICHNQKLQILIFMVYKPPNVQLTKKTIIIVMWWKFVMKSSDNSFYPDP